MSLPIRGQTQSRMRKALLFAKGNETWIPACAGMTENYKRATPKLLG